MILLHLHLSSSLELFWTLSTSKTVFNSPEGPVKLLLRAPGGGDVDGEQELLEVDEAVLVDVERPEDVVAELAGVAGREALAVDLHEGLGVESAVGAVLLEALVPLVDGVLVVVGVGLEEVQVVLVQAVLGVLGPHPWADWTRAGSRARLSPC